MIRILRRIRQSSSYQVGLLFAVLILSGMFLAAYLFMAATPTDSASTAPPLAAGTLRLIGGALLLVLLLIFALSYGVSYYVGTRFERIAAATRRIIATGNLGERLPVDSTWDDLSKLAVLLNTMLAELELRVDGIKAVSDNIAHDLRTPLTRLRARIEASAEGSEREALLADVDRILTIFRSLLRISAIEAGKQPLALAPVDVADLIADAAALYEPLAADRSIAIRLAASPVRLTADRDLLFQALVNLIDNAVKFSPAGGEIRVEARERDAQVELGVSDEGPGIPEAQRERVVTRFQRLDESRSTPGNGLGLALVEAIAHRHGGHLKLGSRIGPAGEGRPGLVATLSLPSESARRDAA